MLDWEKIAWKFFQPKLHNKMDLNGWGERWYMNNKDKKMQNKNIDWFRVEE